MKTRSRRALGGALARGAFAGACCGFSLGVLEVIGLALRGEIAATAELMLWAGGLVGLAFSLPGALVEGVRARLAPAAESTRPGSPAAGAHAWFACLVLGVLTIGRWRYYLDESLSAGEEPASKLLVVLLLLACGALLGAIAAGLAKRFGPVRFSGVWLAASLLLAVSFLFSRPEDPPAHARSPAADETEMALRTKGSASPRPHVFLIVADSLRADALQLGRQSSRPKAGDDGASDAHGKAAPARTTARTPALDRLARESVVFDALCAQSSWTKPGFASILTGLPPRMHHAVRRVSRLPSAVTTLAERFHAGGYFTFGHSNANPNNSAAANFDQGFDEYTDLRPPLRRLFAPAGAELLALYRQVVEPAAQRLVGFDAGHFYVPADDYTDRILARIRTLPKAPTRPIFAVLHYMDPHYPYFAGERRGRPVLLGSDIHRKADPSLGRSLRNAYLGDVELLDRHLGRLFTALRARGLYDDAIIVFTSDHGEELFEHADWGHGRSLYQEVTHVPLILKLPRSRGAGTRIAPLASQIDLAPTLLALAGLPIPDELIGTTLVGAAGESRARLDAECHSTLDTTLNQIESVRTPAATYIRTLRTNQARLAPVEVYDRLADPSEAKNIAAQDAARVADLEARLAAAIALWQEASDPEEDMPVPPDLEAQMRALGYLDDE